MTTKIREGLICWYDFVCDRTGRNNIHDFSGNGNDLIISNPSKISWDGKDNIIITENCELSTNLNIPITSISKFTLHFRTSMGDNNNVYGILANSVGNGFGSPLSLPTNDPNYNESRYITYILDITNSSYKRYIDGIYDYSGTYGSFAIGSSLNKLKLLASATVGIQTGFGDIRLYDRALSDEEIYNLVHRKSFIDETGRVYSKSFNTDGVTTPKIKETGLDYPTFDGTKIGVNLSETVLGCNDIEAI